MTNFAEYEARIEATNYALTHDDGLDVNYADAEVILVGVSRVGKTPTCLYMALHYGVRAANYPLTEDDLDKLELPPRLRAYKSRLFGLDIDPQRLAQVREARKPGSRYAKLEQCRHELALAEKLFRRETFRCRTPRIPRSKKSRARYWPSSASKNTCSDAARD